MKCEHCHTEMKQLLTSMYCINDCDRIPEVLTDAPTAPIPALRCPQCRSLDNADFDLPDDPNDYLHCWDCGHVWEEKW